MLTLQSIYFGQRHPDFSYEDYEIIRKVRRLAFKHLRQATNDCNGEGFVNGIHYYAGSIDDYVRQQYGEGVRSAYIDESEETIFCKEMEKIEAKIEKIIAESPSFSVEYQGDSRGATVKLNYQGEYIEMY